MFNEYSFVPRSADIKRAWLGSLRILPSAPVPTARGRLKERRETGRGRTEEGRKEEEEEGKRLCKSVGGCGDPKPTGHCFLPFLFPFIFSLFFPISLPLFSPFSLLSLPSTLSHPPPPPLIFSCILSRRAIFLRGLKSIG